MQGKEAALIELTEQQIQAVAAAGATPPTAVDPTTNTAYVLLRKDVYEHLTSKEYDDSPWTDEEMEALAWRAGQSAGWDEMDDYDRYEKKPCTGVT